MKFWTIAGILTGLVIATIVARKSKAEPIPVEKNPDRRYNIDDFLADQEL